MSFYIMMKGKIVSLAQTKAVTDTWEPHQFYSQSSQSLKPSELYSTLVYIVSSMFEHFNVDVTFVHSNL